MLLPSLRHLRPALWLGTFALLASCARSADRVTAPKAGTAPTADATYPAGPNLWIVEFMADPQAIADASGEWLKLYNPGPTAVNLQNYKIVSATGTTVYFGGATGAEQHTISASIVVPVGGCVVLGNNTNPATNGNVTEAYSYGTSITLGNNNTDWVEIKTDAGVLLDSVAYSTSTVAGTVRTIIAPSVTPSAGISKVVSDPSLAHVVAASAPWANTGVGITYGTTDRGTPNTCVYTQRVGPPTGPVIAVTVTPVPTSFFVGGTSVATVTATSDGTPVSLAGLPIAWSATGSGTVSFSSTTDSIVTITGLTAGSVALKATVTIGGSPYDGTAGVTVSSTDINWIDVSSSSTSFPAGFQTQLFATARTASGGTIIPATFTFESVDPGIATAMTVNNTGIITGVAGSATKPGIKITATPISGGGPPYVFISRSITIEDDLGAGPIYGDNAAMGMPTPASASDPNDFLIQRPQYTISYNQSRGTPNWVSYELDARHIVVGADRCNCFTADPLLPAAKQIFTSDYTSGGYDRGHMARSLDRTASNGENARTFYLTNIVPQHADLNQGVWANFENILGDSARLGGKAVYIITGPHYNAGASLVFLKGEGKVAIPDSTWKVALIVKRRADGTPYDITSLAGWNNFDSVTVLAVMMPNRAGVRGDPWQMYLRTVDQVEATTGLNFLSLIPLSFQNAIEAGDRGPSAVLAGPDAGGEGQALGFDASASTDPDFATPGFGEVLSFAWTFGDGSSSTSPTPTKTFADNGSFNVALTVTDKWGWPRMLSKTVVVANAAPIPAVAPAAGFGATVKVKQIWTGNFTFSDAGANDKLWKLRIDWGDGTAVIGIGMTQAGLVRSKSWNAPGVYHVTYTVTDKDGATAVGSYDVTVIP